LFFRRRFQIQIEPNKRGLGKRIELGSVRPDLDSDSSLSELSTNSVHLANEPVEKGDVVGDFAHGRPPWEAGGVVARASLDLGEERVKGGVNGNGGGWVEGGKGAERFGDS
jgi:hypothetical protein